MVRDSATASAGDRHIPRRCSLDPEVAFRSLTTSHAQDDTTLSFEMYKHQLHSALLGRDGAHLQQRSLAAVGVASTCTGALQRMTRGSFTLAADALASLPETSYLRRTTRGRVNVPLFHDESKSSMSTSMFRTANSDGISGADVALEASRARSDAATAAAARTSAVPNVTAGTGASVTAAASAAATAGVVAAGGAAGGTAATAAAVSAATSEHSRRSLLSSRLLATTSVGGVDDAPQFASASAIDVEQQLQLFGTAHPRIFEFSTRDAGESRRRHRHRRQRQRERRDDAPDLFRDDAPLSATSASTATIECDDDATDADDDLNVQVENANCIGGAWASTARATSRLLREECVFGVPPPLAARRHELAGGAAMRRVPKIATRMHDATGVGCDFYLQLMASAADRNQLALALGEHVWLMCWDKPTRVCLARPGGSIGSVAFARGADARLGVGTSTGVHLFDTERAAHVGTLQAATYSSARAFASMSWFGAHLLAAGLADGRIVLLDVRTPPASGAALVLSQHRGIVCGLDFSTGALLASGGNDGLLCIWDQRSTLPLTVFEQHPHAAVKALAWHPTESNVLASGGGSADRSLRLWDVAARRCFNQRDTRSQVTGLAWSKVSNELCTTQGYADDGSIVLWSSPDLTRVARLHQLARSERVLYMCASHDGRSIAAADTLDSVRFWNVFDDAPLAAHAVDDDAPLPSTVVGPLVGMAPAEGSERASASIMRPPKRQRRRVSKFTIR